MQKVGLFGGAQIVHGLLLQCHSVSLHALLRYKNVFRKAPGKVELWQQKSDHVAGAVKQILCCISVRAVHLWSTGGGKTCGALEGHIEGL